MAEVNSPVKQVPDRCLRTWNTHRVGVGFMNSFSASRDYPDELDQLERIVAVLKDRDFGERLDVYRDIDSHLRSNIRQEDYERAAVLKDMREYYKARILD